MLVVVMVMVVGCGSEAFKMGKIRAKFPKNKLAKIPDRDEWILIKQNGDIIHISVGGSSGKLYGTILFFGDKK